MRLREIAHPLLERLADRTGESTHLAVLDEPDVVGIDHVESSRPVLVVRHPVGSRVPAHATAVGQALLAHLPDAAEMVISAGLELHTGATISDPEAFRRTLAEVRDRGYAINVRQWYAETAGVAAPVRAPDGEVLAALGISGPATRVSGHRLLAELGVEARAAADEIALRLAAARSSGTVDSSASRPWLPDSSTWRWRGAQASDGMLPALLERCRALAAAQPDRREAPETRRRRLADLHERTWASWRSRAQARSDGSPVPVPPLVPERLGAPGPHGARARQPRRPGQHRPADRRSRTRLRRPCALVRLARPGSGQRPDQIGPAVAEAA